MEVILLYLIAVMIFSFEAGSWLSSQTHQHAQQEQTCDQQCWQQKMCTQPKYWHLPECIGEKPRP